MNRFDKIPGALVIDKMAHEVYIKPIQINKQPARCLRCGSPLHTAYHEERLYSVRCLYCKTVTLVKEQNPVQAALKIGR